jgi:hypothetical protein
MELESRVAIHRIFIVRRMGRVQRKKGALSSPNQLLLAGI